MNGINITMTDPDTDEDGLPDWWEMQNFSNLLQTAGDDFDRDGMSNGAEYGLGTSPTNATSVARSISGMVSYAGPQAGMIVISADTRTGAWDSRAQTAVSVPGSFSITNVPTLADYWIEAYRDSNGNGTNDEWEATGFYATNSVQLTGNLSGLEIVLSDPDSDGDGLPDWWEIRIVDADPNDNIRSIQDVCPKDDFDGDGVSNGDEYARGTSPTDRTSLPPVLEFADSATAVVESNVTVALPLRLYPSSPGSVVARIYVTSSTAINEVDYQFSQTDITFSPGQTNSSFSVTINRQNVAESDKAVVFEINLLSGPAVLGSRNRHVLNIVDDTDGTGADPAPGWVPDTEDTLKFRLLTPSNDAP